MRDDLVESLETGEVFVFGSNTAGRHGAGAAKTAMKWGARYGQGEGLAGQTYALPTKDGSLRVLPIDIIADHAQSFCEFARTRRDLRFLMTEVGCGLAKYTPSQIAPMFADAPSNVVLPSRFAAILRARQNIRASHVE